ncbi:hypothetical protein [Kitasatospora herbaricolor]|uniref:Resolvase/invertase-type recombinase catalytic domain-containing protein n=1 Tax=Kitasatospora herbaricolor TaxID=68217 RepID=A0ABZ1WH31_9ACTN|nr:hypothetical protein [Kitasatospora herbaricolor]
MPTSSRQRRGRAGAAMYLRCYPYDSTGMECHRRALGWLAHRHALPEPAEYLDNGRRPADGLPQLECVARYIEWGWIRTLLIPGPFVFNLDDGKAADMADRLRGLGCRLVELPVGGPCPDAGPAEPRAFQAIRSRLLPQLDRV